MSSSLKSNRAGVGDLSTTSSKATIAFQSWCSMNNLLLVVLQELFLDTDSFFPQTLIPVPINRCHKSAAALALGRMTKKAVALRACNVAQSPGVLAFYYAGRENL